MSPRMVASLAFCTFAVRTGSLHAQEYSPVVEDRFETGVVQPLPVVEEDPQQRGGWDLGAVISAAYDDNIFLSATDPESDVVFRVAPTVAYTKGDDAVQGPEGGFVRAGYRPTAVFYAGNGSESRIDHQALASAGWRGKVTRLTYEGAFQKLGDATADTGRPTDRIEFANELRAAWIAREKVSLELGAGNRAADYQDPALFDSDKTYGEVALRYAYSPKTQLGVIYQIGRFKVDGAGPQHTQQVTGAIDWQPREKIRVKLEAGAEHRRYDNGSGVNPVVEGRVDWTPRKGTELFVTAYMREEASAFYAGQNYGVRGMTAGFSQRIGSNWTAQLEGGVEKNSYENVSGTGIADRTDRIWFVRPSLIRKIGDQSDVSLFYRVSDNSSSDPVFGYDQQMLGIEFNHKF